jgi:hypothetical protein
MKKTATALIAGVVVIVMIILLNSLCAGCVYAQQNSLPTPNIVVSFIGFGETNSNAQPIHAIPPGQRPARLFFASA